MFLLKRATTVVLLLTLFGILLPGVYIQPAQAEGEIQARIQTRAQPGAERGDANGLRCFSCRPCEDNKDLGCTVRCSRGFDYCIFGQVVNRFGFKDTIRGCAELKVVQEHSCDEFAYNPHGENARVCACQTDLCNNQDATSLPSSSTQLLPFWILMAVFGLLMIK